MRWKASVFAGFLLTFGVLHAHPVPRESHDRTIVVRLAYDTGSKRVKVRVAYRLEADEFTVVTDDLKPFRDEVDPNVTGSRFYGEFTRIYAPIFAKHLSAEANGEPLTFLCASRDHTLNDEQGQPLGHLRCDFVFQAEFSPRPERENRFQFREDNYQLQEGKIIVTLETDANIRLSRLTQPSSALQNRPLTQREAGDEDRLRVVSAVFDTASQPKQAMSGSDRSTSAPVQESSGTAASTHDNDLLHLFLNSESGFWLLMLLAAWFGAVHALTPGHGKTLVAAYLVGEQGTPWHAFLLGLITTVTHTGVVILFAIGLLFVPRRFAESMQAGLGLIMGLLVASLGLWLLLKRLSGGHDHLHLGGGHHHHHDHAYHDHDHHHNHEHDHSHVHPVAQPGSRLNTWGLIVLGVTGGIIPCWDAVALLFWTMGTKQFWLALPALLAFSAGLAGVLIGIGIIVVKVRAFAGSKWGAGRIVRILPIISAICVTAIGFWLCYASVNGASR